MKKVKLICKNCNMEFKVFPYRAKTAKYCSYKCLYESRRGQQIWRKRKRSYKGELNPSWQKDASRLTYIGIHSWVYANFGKADHCSFDRLHVGNRYEWSNISGRYLRNINDWQQLCKPCHSKFDNFSGKMAIIRKNQETLKWLIKYYLGKRTRLTYVHEKRYRYAFS